MEEKYLVCVTDVDNHNKYYRMIPEGATFKVEYGRVGATGMTRIYPASKFWDKYNEKIAKGYRDVTDYRATDGVKVTSTAANSYAPISNKKVKAFVDKLLIWADKVIKQHYTVSSSEVSSDAIDKAQKILNNLATLNNDGKLTLRDAEYGLREIWTVVPRKMSNVASMYPKDVPAITGTLMHEQYLLDTMASRIAKKQPEKTVELKDDNAGTSGNTILDANGLEIRECTDEEIEAIKSHLDPETLRKFDNAFHVVNVEQRKRFDVYCKKNKVGKKNIHMLYHGSRNNCYWSILVNNLCLHPTMQVSRAGAMFGYGLYFAPKAKKSTGYTSLSGTFWAKGNQNEAALLLYKVAMKNVKHLDCFDSAVRNWDKTSAAKAGFDSVFAHASANPSLSGGRLYNDECIVYDEDACTLSYVITLKN